MTEEVQAPSAEAEARALGWVPQEEFRGDSSKWVDAETFVRRGREQLPLLQAENRKLRGQVSALGGKVTQLEQLFESSQEAITELKNFHETTFNARIKAERAKIRSEIRTARKEGDVDAEFDAQDRLEQLDEEVKGLETTAPAKKPEPTLRKPAPQGQGDGDSPEFAAWRSANPWFLADQRKAGMVYGLAQQLRIENPDVVGKAFFDLLDDAIAENLPTIKPKTPTPTPGKVDGARSGGAGGGGKSYDSLPAEAKAVAERQAKTFVGTNKAFKTNKEWFDHYAKVYFDQEAA